jgi:hypothetical protein
VRAAWRKSLTGILCIPLFLGSASPAQEGCNVEIKLLLSPTEPQTAIAALKFERLTAGRVYFFDTSALDLLARGVIVRLRQGASNDLTVKLRPPTGTKPFVPSRTGEGFDCEVDLIGGARTPSYAVRTEYAATRVPETGAEILSMLDTGQKKLLNEAQFSIDWSHVKQTKAQPGFGKLTLELWEWPGGKILELSTKVGPEAGQSAYTELQRLVNAKRLSLSATQRAKTGMVLETLTHTASPQPEN